MAAHIYEVVQVASLPAGQLQRRYGVPAWWGRFESYAAPLDRVPEPPPPPPYVAYQSSTLNASTRAGAAVDGNYATFSSTAAQVKPWWAVDLQSVQRVASGRCHPLALRPAPCSPCNPCSLPSLRPARPAVPGPSHPAVPSLYRPAGRNLRGMTPGSMLLPRPRLSLSLQSR